MVSQKFGSTLQNGNSVRHFGSGDSCAYSKDDWERAKAGAMGGGLWAASDSDRENCRACGQAPSLSGLISVSSNGPKRQKRAGLLYPLCRLFGGSECNAHPGPDWQPNRGPARYRQATAPDQTRQQSNRRRDGVGCKVCSGGIGG
jgi:hypothetical protein